jgi:hypothetical protein
MGFLSFWVVKNGGCWGRKLRFLQFLYFFGKSGRFLLRVVCFLTRVVLFFALFKILVFAGE